MGQRSGVFVISEPMIRFDSPLSLAIVVRALGPSLPAAPSNLPIIAVYTKNKAVSAVVPGIATSKDAVQALAQRFAMQTVVDVLEIEGRRALLPDFVISNILGQLQVNTTYEPLECQT
ncbi:hypothetical protein KIN20_007189 [Parelaphostrongylus tenuis]|uniref:Uncharacterized protein n=1 Tax=Parelaphostrongylus tenuis TaxID=148309 RepID=A0AAD5ML62_PARTN|nr:hypothetical protein KIN20_007189 [Parelaphostrongylus tenuis]